MAVLRPLPAQAQGWQGLLKEWAEIKNRWKFKEAVERSKQRTQEQTKQKAEMQKKKRIALTISD